MSPPEKPSVPSLGTIFPARPLECAGPPGTVCPVIDEDRFFDFSFNLSHGAVTVAAPYAATLYQDDLSCTSWTPGSGYDCADFADGETYAHVLTNAWGVDGNFNPSSLADGLYQVSVEIEDDAGNARSATEFVSVNNSGTPLTPASAQPDVYVRDNPVDVGAIPSTLGGEPFWTSPDVMVFPKGTPGITADANPGSGQVQAGVTYDVYVRVQNDRCAPVNGIKVQLYSADPSTLNTQDDWIAITPEGAFVGAPSDPDGLDLSALDRGLVGPFEWTPTAAETSANGHRCLLAYIDALSDPIGATLARARVEENNNAAQRNIQVGDLDTAFAIINPQGDAADVGLDFDGSDFPLREPGSLVELTVAYHPAVAAAWSNVSGATYHRNTANHTMVFEFDAKRVSFPAVTLPALTRLPASVELALPSGVEGEHIVHFSESLNGDVRGGMSFSIIGAPIIK